MPKDKLPGGQQFSIQTTFVARTTCIAIVPVARQVLEKLFVNFTYTGVTFTLVIDAPQIQQIIKHVENIFHFPSNELIINLCAAFRVMYLMISIIALDKFNNFHLFTIFNSMIL